MFDRTIKPYILILALIFVASFLAGTSPPLRSGANDQDVSICRRQLSGACRRETLLHHPSPQCDGDDLLLISGVIIGIIPIFAMGSNGFILGVMYRHAAEVSGYSKAALKVLPHGVFEIPALLIAASYGLWLGVWSSGGCGARKATSSDPT